MEENGSKKIVFRGLLDSDYYMYIEYSEVPLIRPSVVLVEKYS